MKKICLLLFAVTLLPSNVLARPDPAQFFGNHDATSVYPVLIWHIKSTDKTTITWYEYLTWSSLKNGRSCYYSSGHRVPFSEVKFVTQAFKNKSLAKENKVRKKLGLKEAPNLDTILRIDTMTSTGPENIRRIDTGDEVVYKKNSSWNFLPFVAAFKEIPYELVQFVPRNRPPGTSCKSPATTAVGRKKTRTEKDNEFALGVFFPILLIALIFLIGPVIVRIIIIRK